MERFLHGEQQKKLASDLRVAVSTIAAHCTTALSAFVNTPNASHAPILVVMAALAARSAGLPPAVAVVEPQASEGAWLVHVELPGATLRDRLLPSEHAVALLSIEGRSYTQMAQARRASERTIANLAACFSKLGISGRAELRAKAVRELCSSKACHDRAPAAGSVPPEAEHQRRRALTHDGGRAP